MRRRSSARLLAAVLFTDIVDSTAHARQVGDRRWKELIGRHHAIVRRELKRFGGRELDTAGDGFFASFNEPAAAIRCACATVEAVRQLGIEIRTGVHFGECEQVGSKLGGLTVVVGARVMSLGGAGDVLITGSTRELIGGADLGFAERGRHVLKGVDGEWNVFAVTEVDGATKPGPIDADEAAQRLTAIRPTGAVRRAPSAAQKTSRRWVVGIGIALVLALVAISVPLLRSGDGAVDIGTNSIARINADGSLEFPTELGQRPGASAIGFGSLWVAEPDRGVVARLDLEDGSVVDTIPVGTSPAGVAVGEGSVWVTNAGDGTVSRINVDTNEESQTLDTGTGPSGIAFGDGVLWVADAIGAQLLRVDPSSGEAQSVPLAGSPSGVAFTPSGVWVSAAPAGVARVDPADLSVTLTQSVGNGPTAVLYAFGSIWVANHLDGSVFRLEPSTGRVEATIAVGDGPGALGATASSLWVANQFDGSITAIDPATNIPEPAVPVGGAAVSLAADGDGLWLAVGASATEHRGGTLTVSSAGEALTSLDPAVVYVALGWQILSITNDGLLAYKKVGGADGATLVPDLASALPQVSADGLTYRFPLREGIRYSTGDPVRPEDFRHALERTLSLNTDPAYWFSAIDGADACAEDPSTCDLSDSIVADDEAVTFHLVRPDPDLPLKLAMPAAFPVPVTTPVQDQGLDPVPATGPYMVSEAGVDGLELVRNPEFHEWSGAAQPYGFVDSISWRFNEELASSFDQLSAGELDWMTNEPEPEDLASLQAAHPDQVVLSQGTTAFFVGFDVRKPPFDDVGVRQALNYAIDRDHVVELLGGPTSQRPTCQILPPNFPGYEPFCPYTLEPDTGVWSAPDLDRARALIEDADAVGEKVTVWVTDAPFFLPPGSVETMRYVVGVLNDLRLRADLKIVHDGDEYFDAIYEEGEPQAYMGGWFSDYLGAGGFIDVLFRCRTGDPSGLCIESLDAQIEDAQRLQVTDPAASNSAWIEIEHQLVEEAVWAPLTNSVSPYAFSARTENIQVHPQWGILLSRLWVQ